MPVKRTSNPIRAALRETLVILVVWAVFGVWVLAFGRHQLDLANRSEVWAEPSTAWGMPSWVFWGVALPWLLATLSTIGICLWVIRDDTEDGDA